VNFDEELQNALGRALDGLRSSLDASVRTWRDEITAAAEAERRQAGDEAAAAATAAAREEAQRDLDATRQQAQRELDTIRDQCQRDVSEVREQAQHDLHAVREEAQRDLAATREQAERDLDAVREQARQDLETVREQAQRDVEAERERARLERDAAREQARHDLDATREQAQRDLEAAREQAQQELLATREQARHELDNVREAAKRENEEFQRAAEARIAELVKAPEQARAELAAARADMERARSDRDAARAAVEEMRRQLGEARDSGRRGAEDVTRAQLAMAAADHQLKLDAALAQLRAEQRETTSASAERLAAAVRELDQPRGLGDILDVLTRCGAREAERAAILLVKGNQLQALRFANFPGVDARPMGMMLSLEDAGILRDAAWTGVAATHASPDGGAALPAFAQGAGGRCAVALPLVIGGVVVAVLYADTPYEADAATPPWTSVLDVLTRHAARVLEATTLRQAVGLAAEPLARASQPL
jgi:hypothetical protein